MWLQKKREKSDDDVSFNSVWDLRVRGGSADLIETQHSEQMRKWPCFFFDLLPHSPNEFMVTVTRLQYFTIQRDVLFFFLLQSSAIYITLRSGRFTQISTLNPCSSILPTSSREYLRSVPELALCGALEVTWTSCFCRDAGVSCVMRDIYSCWLAINKCPEASLHLLLC